MSSPRFRRNNEQYSCVVRLGGCKVTLGAPCSYGAGRIVRPPFKEGQMAERNKVLSKDYDAEKSTGSISFIEGGNVLNYVLSDFIPALVIQAALHGLNQKLGDAASGLQGEEAEDAVMSVFEQLKAGNWNAAREKGEARPSAIAEAVFEFKTQMGKLAEGETLETVVARYAGKEGAKMRATAMKRPEVAAIIERKKIERAQAKLAKLQAAGAAAATGDVAAL